MRAIGKISTMKLHRKELLFDRLNDKVKKGGDWQG